MKCSILGGNLVHLDHMYKVSCPKPGQAPLLGKDFHLYKKRPVLISILMPRFPIEHRTGSSCLRHLHLFEPLLFFFFNGTLVKSLCFSLSVESFLSL